MNKSEYDLRTRIFKDLVSLITDVHTSSMNSKLDITKTIDRCDILSRDIINDVKHTIQNDK